MLEYQDYYDVAVKVFDSLGISDDLYLSWTTDDAKQYMKQYRREYIASLVDAEMANLDTTENTPSEIQDFRRNVIEEVEDMISDNLRKYSQHQVDQLYTAYNQVVEAIENANIPDVVSVDVDYDPADPDVGIYGDRRAIVITLANGGTITMEVSLDID